MNPPPPSEPPARAAEPDSPVRRLNRLYEALIRVGRAIMQAESRDALFEATCRLLVEIGGFRTAWMGWVDPATHQIKPIATAGDETGYVAGLQVYSDLRPEGRGPTGTAVREQRTCVCNDFFADPATAPWRAAADRSGFRASISLPVRANGAVVGALSVYAVEPGFFGAAEISLLEKTAEDLSFALDNFARDAHRREAEAALRASESRFRAVFQNNLDGVLFSAPNGRILAANPAACRLLGRTEAEIIQGGRDAVIALDDPRLPVLLEERQRTGQAQGVLTMIRSDGSRFEAEVASMVFQTDEGPRASVVIRDISARLASETALRERELELREAQRLARVGSWRLNSLTSEVHWSEELYRMLGLDPAGPPPPYSEHHRLFTPESWQRLSTTLAHSLAAGTPYELELELVRPNGTRGWMHARGEPVYDARGQCVGMRGIAQDITSRRDLERQLEQSQRMEAIGTLSGGIAHDLNNVLSPILMVAGMLKERLKAESDRNLLGMLESEARRAAEIVRQLLAFSRGLAGKRMFVQPRHVLRDVSHIIRETFPREIDFRCDVSGSLSPVLADPTQLHQVLLNLCVNARDAMPDGGRLRIEARNRTIEAGDPRLPAGARPGAYVELEVGDTGHGIPLEIRERIFEPFFTTKPVGKGTGLGLSTVLGIVRSHEGFIRLESEPGQGSTFRVFLPAAPPEPTAAATDAPAARPAGRGRCVLVVDDERSIREAAQKLLGGDGYQVILAVNGEDALGQYRSHRDQIDLVLTDLMMPVLGGLALIRQLRMLDPDLPIVAMSGLVEIEQREELERLGVANVLPKPISTDILLAGVARGLGESPPPRT